MKTWVIMLFVLAPVFMLQAQVSSSQNSKVEDLSKLENKLSKDQDYVNERIRASQTLRQLVNGSIVVRLKTNPRNVDAYRKAGKNEIADRIEADRRKQNDKIYQAFVHNFTFCKVYFIYAHETEAFLNGHKGLQLNRNLEHDPSILFTDTNFIFCEYGSVEPFSDFNDQNGLVAPSKSRSGELDGSDSARTSTSPVYGFFFSDKNLKPFQRPFPYIEDAYFGAFDRAVRGLNNSLHKAYIRLVTEKEYKDRRKQERKKMRQMLQE